MVVRLCGGRCVCCDKDVDFDFAEGTTCHGFKRFCNDWNLIRRIIWFIIVTASFALLIQQLYDRFSNFLKFELKTDFKNEILKEMVLPTITICNANIFFKSRLITMDYELFNITKGLEEAYVEKLINAIYNGEEIVIPTNAKEVFWKMADDFEIKEKAILAKYPEGTDFTVDKWIRRTGWNVSTSDNLLNRAANSYSSIIDCKVGKRSCKVDDFRVVNSRDGLCYSFNYNETYQFKQKIAGTDFGLRLIVDVDEDDYTDHNLDGEERYGSGLKVVLHDWYDQPDLGMAVGVPTGSASYVAARKSITTTVNQAPWGTCKSKFGKEPYSRRKCLLGCQTQATVKACGCRFWYQPKITASTDVECGVAKTLACSWSKQIFGDKDVDDSCVAACDLACEETNFQYGASYTRLVSTNTIDEFQSFLHQATGVALSDDQESEFNATFIANNILTVDIGYSQLSLETISSSPAQQTSSFVSDLGGQLGLFAGISVVTLFEILEYPLLKIWFLCKLNKNWNKKGKHHKKDDNGPQTADSRL